MKYYLFASLVLCWLPGEALAQRGRGPVHSGGGFSGGGGMARPMPQMQRPQIQQPQMQRPSVSVPNMGGINRPTPNFNQRPSMPTMPTPRPSVQPGNGQPGNRLPSGGFNPGGGNRPGFPSTGLPTTRPTPGTTLPGNNRPSVQPPVTTLPGVTRPNPGITRPTPLPGQVTNPGIPTTKPKPLPGNGADIGLDRPVRPTNPIARPTPPIDGGNINRPGIVNPGMTRPAIRPPTTRPIINQPVAVKAGYNNIINTRPGWATINNVTINNINNQWNQSIINRPMMHNYWNNYPNRINYWNGWGNNIRNHWGYYHQHSNWFGPTWWNRYCPPFGGWHYHYWLPYYSYNYWWSVPTWARVTTWFSWNLAANAAWQQPIYYDYGQGGNVYSQNNTVYIGGQAVSSVADFAESAAVLATPTPPRDEEQAAAAEWMPLGTFAMSTGERDSEPTRVVQLAISKDGILSGTLYNYQTEQSAAIQGQVDRTTQRVAFRLGERDTLVAETGLYNLMQDEVPVLVHFGTGNTERFLFIRLKNEETGQGK